MKPPAVGERKTLKNRIVLSNTNALLVDGLKQLDSKALDDPTTQGQVVTLSDATVDQLRAAEAFKTTQGWKYFRHPSMIMTKEAMAMAEHIKRITERGSGTPQTLRNVLVGERGCGKSTLLLQAMASAFLKGWIVINLPDGESSSNLLSSTELTAII